MFENINKVHFVGIGGVSMSGLAEIMHTEGFIVSGSDANSNFLTNKLKNLGIKVFENQVYENVADDIDMLIYTVAVKENNPEILAAKNKNIKIIDRAELLGAIMRRFKYPISISGTHGKTTTTSMLSEILLEMDVNPTIAVGGILNSIGSNFHIGDKDYFVVESCEYYDSFLKLHPYIGIILNVEKDHTDYFKDISQIQNSFNQFAKNIDENGYLIINKNILGFEKIISGVSCNIVTFGGEDADFSINNLTYKNGLPSFDVNYKGSTLKNVILSVPGNHNIQNALASLATIHSLELPLEDAVNHLQGFKTPNRRFQFKGEFNNIKIIDDYAHHPTEIQETLSAVKKQSYNKIFSVFQPHTYTRTKAFLNEFVDSFEDADVVVLLDIYAAREKDTGLVSSKNLVELMEQKGKDVIYANSFEDAEKFLLENCSSGDVIITMGAGDVYLIGEHILSR